MASLRTSTGDGHKHTNLSVTRRGEQSGRVSRTGVVIVACLTFTLALPASTLFAPELSPGPTQRPVAGLPPFTRELAIPQLLPPLSRTGTTESLKSIQLGTTNSAVPPPASARSFQARLGSVVTNISVGVQPSAVLFDNLTGDVYVANEASDNVTIINGSNGQVDGGLRVGTSPDGDCFSPLNGFIYVTNFGSNTVSIISGVNRTLHGTVHVGSNPTACAFDPADGLIMVANYQSDNLTVIPPTGLPGPSIPVGIHPTALVADPRNGTVFVANWGSGNVTVIGGSPIHAIAALRVSSHPDSISIDPSDEYAYVTDGIDNMTTVLDGRNLSVLSSIRTLGSPDGVLPDYLNDLVYVSLSSLNNLSVLRDETLSNVSFLAVGQGPWGLALDQSNGKIFVADSVSDEVSVVDAPVNPSYAVNFTESGLPMGHPWTVSIDGRSITSNNRTATFALMNGSYQWRISPIPGFKTSWAGSLSISGTGRTLPVNFSQFVYPVVFEEGGLVLGTYWTIQLGNLSSVSNSTVLSFEVPNGTYAWYPNPVSGYIIQQGGSVVVNGSSGFEFVTYEPVLYSLTFNESGLPAGTLWSVSIKGVTRSNTSDSITFAEPNGNYSWSISPIPGWKTNWSGRATIDGGSASEFPHFVVTSYTVSFVESGLQLGTSWSVTLNSTTGTGTGEVVFTRVPNGTYNFSVKAVSGFTVKPASGSLAVTGSNASRNLLFTAVSASAGNGTGPPKFLGLPAAEGSALVGGIILVVVIGALAAVLRNRGRRTRANRSDPPP
jgi:YVTN family beta-propeller protein